MANARYECESCGACCTNPRENVREGRTDYVAVEPGARLLSRRDWVRKLVVLDNEGHAFMRLCSAGRCSALRGAIGRKVSCEIYHLRPRPCRTVQPGDGDCRRARAEWALS